MADDKKKKYKVVLDEGKPTEEFQIWDADKVERNYDELMKDGAKVYEGTASGKYKVSAGGQEDPELWSQAEYDRGFESLRSEYSDAKAEVQYDWSPYVRQEKKSIVDKAVDKVRSRRQETEQTAPVAQEGAAPQQTPQAEVETPQPVQQPQASVDTASAQTPQAPADTASAPVDTTSQQQPVTEDSAEFVGPQKPAGFQKPGSRAESEMWIDDSAKDAEQVKASQQKALDDTNSMLAENPQKVTVDGKEMNVIAAASVDGEGKMHFIVEDEAGERYEVMTDSSYEDFIKPDLVKAAADPYQEQMMKDIAEMQRLQSSISKSREVQKQNKENQKDDDFVGPTMRKKDIKHRRSDDEDKLKEVMASLNNNPAYRKYIADQRKVVKEGADRLEAVRPEGASSSNWLNTVGMVGLGAWSAETNAPDKEAVLAAGKEVTKYNAAKKMLDKADKILATGFRYKDEGDWWDNYAAGQHQFGKAFMDTIKDPDFWTLGMGETIDNLTIREILEKAASNSGDGTVSADKIYGSLSPLEQELLNNRIELRSSDSEET